MKNNIILISCFVFGIIAAFSFGMHYGEKKLDLEKAVREAVVHAQLIESKLYTYQMETRAVTLENQKKIRTQPVKNTLEYAYRSNRQRVRIEHPENISYMQKAVVDGSGEIEYIIQWDESEGKFKSNDPFFFNRHESFPIFLASTKN